MQRDEAEMILGLPRHGDHTTDDVRAACAEILKRYHPDTNGGRHIEGSGAKIKEAKKARDVLVALFKDGTPTNACPDCCGSGVGVGGFATAQCLRCSGRGWV